MIDFLTIFFFVIISIAMVIGIVALIVEIFGYLCEKFNIDEEFALMVIAFILIALFITTIIYI